MPFLGTQDTSQTLDVLPLRTITADNNRHAAIWHVNTFIEDTACHQLTIFSATEAFQDDAPLLGRRLIGNARQTKTAADLINHNVILREENDQISHMHLQEAFNLIIFGR